MKATASTTVRRGSVLLAVFAIVIVAALLAVTMLGAARSSAFHAKSSAADAASRALANAAVLSLLREFEAERDAMLEGRDPELRESFTLWEDDSGRRAVARLMPFADGSIAAPQNALLDANHASPEALAGLELIDQALAGRIVAARDEAPFTRLADLLAVDGIDTELLFGPADEQLEQLTSTSTDAGPRLPSIPGAPGSAETLADVLTVFSFEPDVMMGLSGEADDFGKRRINLNQEWSDDIRDPVERRYGEEVASVLGRIMNSDQFSFESDADLVSAMQLFGVDVEDWPEILDVFTTEPSDFRTDRVDINRAPVAVLAAIPGVGADLAERIADTRPRDPGAGAFVSPVWLIENELVSRAVFGGISERITTRSLQWRVRVEVGFEVDEEASLSIPGPVTRARSGDLTEVELTNRRILEIVIDAASPRARLASFTDLTALPDALEIAALAEAAAGFDLAPSTDPPGAGPPVPAADTSAADNRPAFMEGLGSRLVPRGRLTEAPEPPGGEQNPDEPDEQADRSEATDPRLGRWTSPNR